MTTTGLTTWETDLTLVGAIYPFQGFEFLFILAAFLLWITGLIVVVQRERIRHARIVAKYGSYETVMDELDNLTAS
ncbi:MAG: hypothetical protein OXC91_03690 [Rhodobacteraceae bacterium]|nr:hypothetical protein [Paracoccaceae bacterium]